MGRDGVGDIATRYGLTVRGPNPAGGGGEARFSASVQTCPGAQPTLYCIQWVLGLFHGSKVVGVRR